MNNQKIPKKQYSLSQFYTDNLLPSDKLVLAVAIHKHTMDLYGTLEPFNSHTKKDDKLLIAIFERLQSNCPDKYKSFLLYDKCYDDLIKLRDISFEHKQALKNISGKITKNIYEEFVEIIKKEIRDLQINSQPGYQGAIKKFKKMGYLKNKS